MDGRGYESRPLRSSPLTRVTGQCNLTIGKYSFLERVTLHLHDTLSIGTHVIINNAAKLFTASHDVSDPFFSLVKRPIVIKDYAWIATGAKVLPGVTIGFGSVAGAAETRVCPAIS